MVGTGMLGNVAQAFLNDPIHTQGNFLGNGVGEVVDMAAHRYVFPVGEVKTEGVDRLF